MERVRSPSPEVFDWYLKSIYPNKKVLKKYLTLPKIENLRLQEVSIINRSLWKLVILLETYMKQTQ